jgi:SARP family transcriptional regulator, regulator of embCAB operon
VALAEGWLEYDAAHVTAVRVYTTGRVCLETPAGVVGERELPGTQGRVLLVHLAAERATPVSRDELADDLWAGRPPPSWDAALSALASKLRRVLAGTGVDVAAAAGGYELGLPSGTWIDLEQAPVALHEAEGRLRHGDHTGAWGFANVASTIASRPLLPGHDSAWTHRRRQRLDAIALRALDCLAEIWLTTGELELAVDAAATIVEREPYREAGYRRLMAVHTAGGNRAEALRVYERCRRLLADELGVDPSPETVAAYRALLDATGQA